MNGHDRKLLAQLSIFELMAKNEPALLQGQYKRYTHHVSQTQISYLSLLCL